MFRCKLGVFSKSSLTWIHWAYVFSRTIIYLDVYKNIKTKWYVCKLIERLNKNIYKKCNTHRKRGTLKIHYFLNTYKAYSVTIFIYCLQPMLTMKELGNIFDNFAADKNHLWTYTRKWHIVVWIMHIRVLTMQTLPLSKGTLFFWKCCTFCALIGNGQYFHLLYFAFSKV